MSAHTDWCAGGHRCQLGEHRADPLTVDIPGAGRVVLTRVRAAAGREYAEVRATVSLAGTDPAARRQLSSLITSVATALRRAA
ncbi:hypothetical protein [Dactylosporangium sp. NPDC049140]|uniref:hypothetical protein n=1 Tax=Dactylosporangium sp. NPDC049140 TaxID=3155647 RepID=UPI0033FA9E52